MANHRYNLDVQLNTLRSGHIGWLDASMEGPHANRVQISEFSFVLG